jgi:two-component system LytT family response regulator
MKIKTFLVDDEQNAVKSLQFLIEKHCPQLEIIGSATSVESAIALIQSTKPELVFLDIEMPTGTGFDVVEQTKTFDYSLIFTTAYDQYAIQAFKVKAIDYLLKPIEIEELIKTVGVLETKLLAKKVKIQPQFDHGKIPIPSSDGFDMVETKDIIRLESDSNYTRIFLVNGQKYYVAKTLKDFEVLLAPKGFIRAHHSHIVNVRYVTKCFKTDGGYLVLIDDSIVPISKNRKQEVFEMLM